jgi:hypothetical protein
MTEQATSSAVQAPRRCVCRARRLLAAGLALLALAGCGRLPWSGFTAPNDMRAFARVYLDRFRDHDWAAVLKDMDPGLRTGQIQQTIERIAGFFPAGTPLDVHVVSSAQQEGARGIQTGITFQYHYPDRWLLANVVMTRTGDGFMVTGINVLPMSHPLDEANRFTFAGKGPGNYVVLALAVLLVLFVLATLVVCARTRIARHKWLWLLFIALGFGRVSFDWVDGQVAFSPVAVVPLAAGYSHQSRYTPPFLQFGLPLGAIVFWVRRRRLAGESGAGESDAASAAHRKCA